jgi:hypothetical protein
MAAGLAIALVLFAIVVMPPIGGIEVWKYVLGAISLWLFFLAGRSERRS